MSTHKAAHTKHKPLLSLHNVWKTYTMGENILHALREVNVEIPEGSFVSIVGPSGSGKSTLMNQLGLLDVPSKGTIAVRGKDISSLKESEKALLRGKTIGFIFQQFNLLPGLSAIENVMLPALFQGISATERKARAAKLLTQLGLGERLDHKPTELSGGQQQRVAIARSLINDPEIILADEPTGNLDSQSGEQVMNILYDLNREKNKTIILITHDVHLVKRADLVLFIKDGQVTTKHSLRGIRE